MTVQITGDKELDRFFATLTGSLQRGALRKGVRAGATAFSKEARSQLDRLTTRRTGRLRKSLGFIRFDNVPSTGEIRAAAGARRRRHQGHHAHLIEFGHEIKRTKGGKSFGRVRPRPFFRTAMRTSQADVVLAVRAKLQDALRKARAR